jgi:hypothetical protein
MSNTKIETKLMYNGIHIDLTKAVDEYEKKLGKIKTINQEEIEDLKREIFSFINKNLGQYFVSTPTYYPDLVSEHIKYVSNEMQRLNDIFNTFL